MKFNEFWQKSDNDELRRLNKNNENVDNKINIFKNNHHPSGKFKYDYLKTYFEYSKIYEITIKPKEHYYDELMKKSIWFNNHIDYILKFTLNEHIYVVILFYIEQNNISSYMITLTTEKQYNEYQFEYNKILRDPSYKFKSELEHKNDHQYLQNIIEKETEFNEIFTLMKIISYILFDCCKNNNIKLLSLGETNNKVKINLYRNIRHLYTR